MRRDLLVVAAALLATPPVRADEEIRNWFHDPWFQVRAGVAACPEPLGPYVTHEKMLAETHYRSERGLRCYLEGKCARSNSYLYDADIAKAVRERFASSKRLSTASLWVTVQRRFVWVEGCVGGPRGRTEIERLLRGVPDMELLLVNVSDKPGAAPPYRVPQAGQRRVE